MRERTGARSWAAKLAHSMTLKDGIVLTTLLTARASQGGIRQELAQGMKIRLTSGIGAAT
jgi:hypothetical protein